MPAHAAAVEHPRSIQLVLLWPASERVDAVLVGARVGYSLLLEHHLGAMYCAIARKTRGGELLVQ